MTVSGDPSYADLEAKVARLRASVRELCDILDTEADVASEQGFPIAAKALRALAASHRDVIS